MKEREANAPRWRIIYSGAPPGAEQSSDDYAKFARGKQPRLRRPLCREDFYYGSDSSFRFITCSWIVDHSRLFLRLVERLEHFFSITTRWFEIWKILCVTFSGFIFFIKNVGAFNFPAQGSTIYEFFRAETIFTRRVCSKNSFSRPLLISYTRSQLIESIYTLYKKKLQRKTVANAGEKSVYPLGRIYKKMTQTTSLSLQQ